MHILGSGLGEKRSRRSLPVDRANERDRDSTRWCEVQGRCAPSVDSNFPGQGPVRARHVFTIHALAPPPRLLLG